MRRRRVVIGGVARWALVVEAGDRVLPWQAWSLSAMRAACAAHRAWRAGRGPALSVEQLEARAAYMRRWRALRRGAR